MKTVAIRVSLHENDGGLGQPGLPLFHGRFGAKFEREVNPGPRAETMPTRGSLTSA